MVLSQVSSYPSWVICNVVDSVRDTLEDNMSWASEMSENGRSRGGGRLHIYIYISAWGPIYGLPIKKTYVLFPSELSSFPQKANHPLRYVATPTLLDLLFLCESACEHLWHGTCTGFHGRALDGMIFASLTWDFPWDCDGCWWILMGFPWDCDGCWWIFHGILMDVGGFWWVFHGIVMDVDGFWWIFHGIVMDVDGFWWIFHGILMDVDGFLWMLMDFNGFWWNCIRDQWDTSIKNRDFSIN